jgi:hypothetical protein
MNLDGGSCGGGTITTTVETTDGQDHPWAYTVVAAGQTAAAALGQRATAVGQRVTALPGKNRSRVR